MAKATARVPIERKDRIVLEVLTSYFDDVQKALDFMRLFAGNRLSIPGNSAVEALAAWNVYWGREYVPDTDARIPQSLLDVLKLLRAADVPASEVERYTVYHAVDERGNAIGKRNELCPVTRELIQRRVIEIGQVSRATEPGLLLSVEGGEQAAPALATILHKYFGTTPAPQPAPPAPEPVANVVQIASDEAELRRAAINKIAGALVEAGQYAPWQRAEMILDAVTDWIERPRDEHFAGRNRLLDHEPSGG